MPLTSDICAYNPKWPALFEAEKGRILETLGDCILNVHHVGSTAIPGMHAKPEIDLLIIIRHIAEINMIHAGMTELGYDVRGECGIAGRYYYSKDTGAVRTHKAHACGRSHSNVRQQLAFRDYLRDHPEEAQAYSALKIQLAEHNTSGMAEYLAGKKDFIDRIVEKTIGKCV